METASTTVREPIGAKGNAVRATTIAIMAMGGEGGGVLADWIVDLAENGGYLAQTTSVPGVAQRTGSTIYYIEIFPAASAEEEHKDPVLALMPVPGELDVVVASELMEAGRAIQREMVTPNRTVLIASTHRVYSMTEKIAIGDAQVDTPKLIEACKLAARDFVHSDFAEVAERTGSVISAALFGALASTNALPFSRTQFEDAIRRGGVGVERSLAGFAAALEVATSPPAEPKKANQTKVGSQLQPLAKRIERDFPPAVRTVLLAGVERLADYQDVRYGDAYLDALQAVRDADTRYGDGAYRLLHETGRYLALWLSYEDAIRVADLKTRRTRFERVRRDTRASASQLVEIHEFLHPGVEEITDILPAALGRWVLQSGAAKKVMERFTGKGKIVHTTSLWGFLQLYLLANLRVWRRGSLRFQEEHKRIDQWLTKIPSLAQENYALAVEFAECPAVVKGYGETHLRGRQNFDAMMAALPKIRQMVESALFLKKLREAALADDTSEKFNQALQELPE